MLSDFTEMPRSGGWPCLYSRIAEGDAETTAVTCVGHNTQQDPLAHLGSKVNWKSIYARGLRVDHGRRERKQRATHIKRQRLCSLIESPHVAIISSLEARCV